ncbi:MAG: hypothetical protein AB1715_13580, partial [Acidobacteriota bacterium]
MTILCIAVAAAGEVSDLPKNLEPYVYKENFESQELNAWASYPLWQDTAFDPNFRAGTLIPGDSNISIIQRVTPYSHVDNYAGAQKKLDFFLVPGSSITLRFYIKTQLKAEFFKIRIPTAGQGVIDFTINDPLTNKWEAVTVPYASLIEQNPRFDGKVIKATGLAVLTKIPEADPDMSIYLGVDDIVVNGAKAPDFRFIEPRMHKLSEWRPYIPQRQFQRGEKLILKGEWPLEASRVSLRTARFTAREKPIFKASLKKKGREW